MFVKNIKKTIYLLILLQYSVESFFVNFYVINCIILITIDLKAFY